MTNFGVRFLTVIAVVVFSRVAPCAEVSIDADGMTVVDGKRTFILGLYENPSDDAVLKAAVDAGINLIHTSASKESLDRLHAAGVGAWLGTSYDIDLSSDTEARRARLTQAVEDFGGHPALLVWEVPDEALWNAWHLADTWRRTDEPKALEAAIEALEDETLAAKLEADLEEVERLYKHGRYAESESLADSIWIALGKDTPNAHRNMSTAPERAKALGAGMLDGYRALRKLDPAHPVWINHAPRNTLDDLAWFNRAADIVGCDIYPVPESKLIQHSDLADRTLASVGKYTDRMQAAAPGKPVWMVLQSAAWGDFLKDLTEEEREVMRRPRKEETRFMAYDAIVHGARGILYWGSAYVEKDSDFWQELLEVMAELDSIQPVLSAPDAEPPSVLLGPTNGSLDRSVVVRTKAAPDGEWHLVVNEWEGPLHVTVQVSDPKDYEVFGENVPLTVGEGGLSFNMPAYSVVVLRPVQGEN